MRASAHTCRKHTMTMVRSSSGERSSGIEASIPFIGDPNDVYDAAGQLIEHLAIMPRIRCRPGVARWRAMLDINRG